MVVFSKSMLGKSPFARLVERLLRNPSSYRPLWLFLAIILIARSAAIPNFSKIGSSERSQGSLIFPLHSQEALKADVPFFSLESQTTDTESKQSFSRSFLQQFKSLLHIVIPSIRSREALLLVVHSCFLVLRTVLSVAVARLDGRIVRNLVSADGLGFLRGLCLWFILAVPSIYTNSMIRHIQSRLSLCFRTRLTSYIHDLYFAAHPHLRYYRVPLQSIDQYITADVAAWSDSFSGIYGNVMKPSLDLLLFTSQLSRSLGFRGTLLLFGNYYLTVRILRAVTPAFGQLAAVEARLEGEYRSGVGRIARESEEIAFYDGGTRERDILTRAYLRLIKHVNSIYKIRIAYEWTEDFVIKYLWSAAGYGLIAVPLLITRKRKELGQSDAAVGNRTEVYISSRRLLLSLADAGSRLMYAYKDLIEVAGLTGRLYKLLSTLHNVPSNPLPLSGGNVLALKDVDICIPAAALHLPFTPKDQESAHLVADSLSTVVPRESDDAMTLTRALSFSLQPGMHLMITGSNGVGKSAIARVLAGLWSPGGALACIMHPDSVLSTSSRMRQAGRKDVLFVVPQRPYMVSGSLLEQVIYPQSLEAFYAERGDVGQLQDILEAAHLGYLVEREGGWEATKEWLDILSGGEKQRMAFARVFYHCPKFVILDECTSAVSCDVEGQMYEHVKSLGISLITISLRPSLMRHHTHLLTINGDVTGSWTFTAVSCDMHTNMHNIGQDLMHIFNEICILERQLKESMRWKERVEELMEVLDVSPS